MPYILEVSYRAPQNAKIELKLNSVAKRHCGFLISREGPDEEMRGIGLQFKFDKLEDARAAAEKMSDEGQKCLCKSSS